MVRSYPVTLFSKVSRSVHKTHPQIIEWLVLDNFDHKTNGKPHGVT